MTGALQLWILAGALVGGGIALQFSYLFPERVRSLVLVASGGLGREVNVLLRAPTLPGSEWILPMIANRWARRQGATLTRGLSLVGLRGGPDLAEALSGFESLGDAEHRHAFLATIRAVVGPDGQRLSAREILPAIAEQEFQLAARTASVASSERMPSSPEHSGSSRPSMTAAN